MYKSKIFYKTRQTVDDGSIGDFEHDTDEPHIPQTPILAIQNKFSGQRMNIYDDPSLQPSSSSSSPSSPDSVLLLAMLMANTEPANPSYPRNQVTPDSETFSGSKRYLLLPAVDNILLRRLYPNHTTALKSKNS